MRRIETAYPIIQGTLEGQLLHGQLAKLPGILDGLDNITSTAIVVVGGDIGNHEVAKFHVK